MNEKSISRDKGVFETNSNRQIKLQAAWDPRITVSTKQELIDKETWPYDDDVIYVYNGLVVSVLEVSAVYMLIDKNNILSTDYSAWKCISVETPASGTTEERPINPSVGYMYFDTTLNIPIWYAESIGWIKSDGTVVNAENVQISYNGTTITYEGTTTITY